jgi:hypothetical protein
MPPPLPEGVRAYLRARDAAVDASFNELVSTVEQRRGNANPKVFAVFTLIHSSILVG